MIIEYCLLRPYGRNPTRSNPSDAGLDIYYNPPEGAVAVIEPGASLRLGTGLCFAIPHGYMLQVMNRSSVASKRDLIVGAHVVDAGYEGEVFVDMHNIGNETQIIEPEEKIAQVVLLPVVHFRPSKVEYENLYEYPLSISQRGTGALGSSDDDVDLNDHSIFEISGDGPSLLSDADDYEDDEDEEWDDEDEEWDDDDEEEE